MPKGSKKQQGISDKLRDGSGLTKEQMFVDTLLFTFETKEVNALVIMEKGDRQCVSSNGISGADSVNFVVDLFLREPELYQATMERLQGIIKEAMKKAHNSKTVH